MKKIYVLDASGYLYRSYFAIQNMTNSKGESTNALFGFIRSVLKLFNDFKPEYFVAIFDGPKGIEKRRTLYPAYKAQRAAMPSDLRAQIGLAQQFCDLMGISKLTIPGVEADDTMAAVAHYFDQKGEEVYLCTGDKDLFQLVNQHIFILNTYKDNLILDEKGVEDHFGVPPCLIRDYLAITGDNSDNVPGIAGFGSKTAVGLLKEFGSLEAILENPEKVGGKKQQILIEQKDQALLSQALVTLNLDIEIPQEDKFYRLGKYDKSLLRQFYSDFDFHSLIKELGEDIALIEEQCQYLLVDDEQSFQELLSLLSQQKEIGFGAIATDSHPLKTELVGLGFAISPKRAWYLPANGKLGVKRIFEGLKPLLESPKTSFYGHNVKNDLHLLANYGVQIARISFDILLASYLLNSHQRNHTVEHLALIYFGKITTSVADLMGSGKKARNIRDVEPERLCAYCCESVDFTCRLRELLGVEIEKRRLENLLTEVELPLMFVLNKMERRGIFLDTEQLKELSTWVNQELGRLESEIFALAGEEFNVRSPQQLARILFEKLQIPSSKKTTTGFSTNADVLEGLKDRYPIVSKVVEYRLAEKLRSTYIDVLPGQVMEKTRRIHCTFNQSVAATGRLSSQDPNLQNIPVRTEAGREIRRCFRPEKSSWSYLAADYSQIELRLLAHMSEDAILIKAFQEGEDIHAYTASLVMGIPLSAVTKEQRYRAKAVNFGIIYGQQAFGLSRELGVSMEEAKQFIGCYFQRYPHVKKFLESCKQEARIHGKSATLLGRERLIPEINSSNMQIRQAAERLAINTPLQGTAADLIKLAMIQIQQEIEEKQKRGFLVLQIHDELIVELPDEEISIFSTVMQQTMENVYPLRVPLVVNISVGKNWKEC